MTGAALARLQGLAQPSHGYACVDFSLGRCLRGQACKFIHVPAGLLGNAPASRSRPGNGNAFSSVLGLPPASSPPPGAPPGALMLGRPGPGFG
mmetsp:Transcript_2187/g.5517  ORF Transcript_2187/g.5517 Transcript_2187/m.5517 type:complete len:93 (-) Transcript_2187:47-325(-)